MHEHINFHHYGLAVKTLEHAENFHRNLGYSISEPIFDKLQNVMLVLCTSNKYPMVELVKPVGDDNPIDSYLKKNNEIIYHVCYELDIDRILIKDFFSKNRFICVTKPRPAVLFNNRLVSFYYLNNVGLVEILHK